MTRRWTALLVLSVGVTLTAQHSAPFPGGVELSP
jgi:hypothetical protein